MTRGFNKLKGITIGAVNATAVNEIALFTEDEEHVFLIEVEVTAEGIPILSCKKHKNIKVKLPNSRPSTVFSRVK